MPWDRKEGALSLKGEEVHRRRAQIHLEREVIGCVHPQLFRLTLASMDLLGILDVVEVVCIR